MDSLRAHKLRSFLTLLGVILAVATLVSVMSVIAGLNKYIADKVADLGANVFVIDRFGIITSEDAWVQAQKRPLITVEEFERFRNTSQLAKQVAGYDRQNSQTRSGDAIMENTQVIGVTSNYAEIENLVIAEGRFITPAGRRAPLGGSVHWGGPGGEILSERGSDREDGAGGHAHLRSCRSRRQDRQCVGAIERQLPVVAARNIPEGLAQGERFSGGVCSSAECGVHAIGGRRSADAIPRLEAYSVQRHRQLSRFWVPIPSWQCGTS